LAQVRRCSRRREHAFRRICRTVEERCTIYWQVWVLALSLGFDNLSVAVGIGAQGVSHRRALFVALVFGFFQALLPAIGLLLGALVGPRLGDAAGYVGFSLLFLLGLVTLVLAFREGRQRIELAKGYGLLFAASGVSLDSLAVGFSLALAGFPMLLTIAALGLSAFVMTWLGLQFGRHIGRWFESWAERFAGGVLAVTGLILLLAKLAA